MDKDKQILEGFNDGYTIQKYEPEIAEQMLGGFDGTTEPYAKGFMAGAKEYQLEKELDKFQRYPGMDQYPERDDSDKSLGKNRGMDIDV